GVQKSAVSRELRRNRGERGYRPRQAHRLALERRQDKAQARLTVDDWNRVEALLREDWSPEQVSLWLAKERLCRVSHEWIYRRIYQDRRLGGDLHLHLRCRKQRRKRYGSYSRRGQLPGRVSIDRRPAIVERRCRLGDWELDTVIGKGHKGALVSLCERKSRLTVIGKVSRKSAAEVSQAAVRLLRPLSGRVRTLTSDNGREFAGHRSIAKALGAKFYFAHPYSSWERGSNENGNGLIRQYLPKGTDFTTVTKRDLCAVMDKLNNRPRKCLGMKTPNQVFFGIKPSVALAS
ncbi:MAG: IS30 family transposase, partial [Gammaproteobacteria bacterium]|nr:IS30 family transposase [Gammaproteobacteria bacterium]